MIRAVEFLAGASLGFLLILVCPPRLNIEETRKLAATYHHIKAHHN
jgi:hypothetical protein